MIRRKPYSTAKALAPILGLALFCAACSDFQRNPNAADLTNEEAYYAKLLAFRADGKSYDSAQLAVQERGLQEVGLTQQISREIILSLLAEGIASNSMADFEDVALKLSRLYSIAPLYAAHRTAAGFTGGFNSIASFDREFNFLTADQYQKTSKMFESGDFSGGRSYAFGLLKAKFASGLSLDAGSMTKAVLV